MATEKRLIDANALWAEFMELADVSIEFDGEGVANAIANAPTVDAVEVVRCEHCKHRAEAKNTSEYFCVNPYYGMASGVELKDDDFCSYGERREGE